MSNKNKIIIGILVVVGFLVIFKGLVDVGKKIKEEKGGHKTNTVNTLFTEYVENKVIENEIVEENVIIEDEVKEKTKKGTVNEEVVGREEQESNQEANTELEDEKQAIELAKEEWGISVDSYYYDVKLKEDKIYEVTVRSKSTTEAIIVYTVNLKTGTVE